MKIISWNINSVRMRANLTQSLLAEHSPDILCLQEVKCQNDQFPAEFFYNLGYHSNCNGQKAYNGVAILSKSPVIVSQRQFANIEDARFISIKYNDWHVSSVYVPNGQMIGSPAFEKQKLFMRALIEYRNSLQGQNVMIAGDFNIAPKDIHADFALRASFICDQRLRDLWYELLGTGLSDFFGDEYTWFDYRWPKMGARLDNVLISNNSMCKNIKATVLNKYRNSVTSPSDHCPVMLEFDKVC